MVEGPGSTLWIYGGLSLRKGILNSVYRFSLSDRRWSAEVRPDGRAPRARYFHAVATSGPALDTMYVAGGLTDSGVASDFWLLDLANAEWTEGEVHWLVWDQDGALIMTGAPPAPLGWARWSPPPLGW
ncbi:hypothetical protein chiPu_0029185, partial [Chiloscyllium punctatum]|nr:hypothetical protein [Chiloscyllium punctatum]